MIPKGYGFDFDIPELRLQMVFLDAYNVNKQISICQSLSFKGNRTVSVLFMVSFQTHTG